MGSKGPVCRRFVRIRVAVKREEIQIFPRKHSVNIIASKIVSRGKAAEIYCCRGMGCGEETANRLKVQISRSCICSLKDFSCLKNKSGSKMNGKI